MKVLSAKARWIFLLLLAVIALGLSGCATPDGPGGDREVPWGSPKGWENGIPGSMTEGR
jgi:hypothetical protein